MRTERTSTDICLLCKENNSDKTGSHFTPAGIIKRVIGARNYEELYSINSYQGSADVYYGRSNLKNTDTEIKKPENVADHIFCSKCEDDLGVIESACNAKLLSLSDELLNKNLSLNNSPVGFFV